jgi:exodeoxyribonuclease V gamma subunit
MLGYAMPGRNRKMFSGILPYDHIEGADAQILGNLFNFIGRLITWSQKLNKPRKLSNWQKTLTALGDRFIKPDENEERELQVLRDLLDNLSDIETSADIHDEIAPEVIRTHLKSRLEQNRYGSGFLTGGVTFCAMLPMRSIPFKVICLVGMGNDAYPRDYQPLNFDLIAKHPQIGDRSRRNDDKYLFLESIISARKKLYISYVGQSIQDNSILPPCVLVSELLDTIEKSFVWPEKNILEKIVTRHRLQSFSPWYFRQGTGLFSYSAANMLAGAAEKAAPRPFVTAKIPMMPEETEKWHRIELESLLRFFDNPARFFIQNRLRIKLEDEGSLSDIRENFVLITLEKYLVEQNLFNNQIAGSTLEDFKPVQKALGQLPPGHVGDFYYTQMSIEVENFVSKIKNFIPAASQDPIEMDLNISGFVLRARLSEISESGYVQIRYARKRVKDLILSWIYHLVFCHLAPPEYNKTSFLICKDSAVQFDPVPESKQFLQALLGLFRRGLEEPIHFFPDSSFEYAVHKLNTSVSDQLALIKAKKKWQGGDSTQKHFQAESEEPYYDLCFRHLDPLDDEFKKMAVTVFEPILAYSREIRLK